MIKISFELVNGFVQGWHEVNEQYSAMFENIIEFNDIENGKTAEEQLLHFNDNYFAYTLKNDKLIFVEEHIEIYNQRQLAKSKIPEIKKQLQLLSEDFSQDLAGQYIPNLAEKKLQFIELHNELRILEGKQPRELKGG